jgi:TPR repeat protein
VKKLFLLAATTFSLCSMTANAATTFEVAEFNRATELSSSAVRVKNYDRAVEHLDLASKLGNKVSQFTLALLYMEGLGVDQDYTQAYLWLNVAAEVNEKKWRIVRDQIHSALTDEQVVALAPLVADYIAKYGAKAQEVSCYRRSATGSNRKLMQCTKYLTPGR